MRRRNRYIHWCGQWPNTTRRSLNSLSVVKIYFKFNQLLLNSFQITIQLPIYHNCFFVLVFIISKVQIESRIVSLCRVSEVVLRQTFVVDSSRFLISVPLFSGNKLKMNKIINCAFHFSTHKEIGSEAIDIPNGKIIISFYFVFQPCCRQHSVEGDCWHGCGCWCCGSGYSGLRL